MESLLDLRKKGGNGIPNTEGHEETKPVAVECSHVWSGEIEHSDLRGSIILISINGASIALVLSVLHRLCDVTMNSVSLKGT